MLKKPLSVKQLLLLAFLLAGLLPAMLVSFLSFYQTRSVLKKEISRDIQTLSATVASNVEHLLSERFYNVYSWGNLAVMQEIQIGDVDKRLASFLQALVTNYDGVYAFIDVVDMQNKVIASSHPQRLAKAHPSQAPWFQVRMGHASLEVFPIQNNLLAISKVIAAPETGVQQGRLIAYFNWVLVQNMLNQSVQSSTAAALFDAQQQKITSSSNWDKIQVQHGLHASTRLHQKHVPAWYIEIEKLHSIAVAPVHRLGYVFLALLISTLLFSVLLVRPIAQAITRPLSQLTYFVQQFFQHKNSPIPTTGPVEIQALSQAFEKMMTELETSQINLNRAAKLAVVGEMAAAMSHEVRTPLGILRSSADVLQREPALSKEGHEVLGFIISETERLNKLVSSLIDSAKPRLPVLAVINLTALIGQCIAMLMSQAHEKNITINFTQTSPLIVNADSDQLTQVLMNLLINAIQVLPQHGKIDVTLATTQTKVMLSIADNGKGITTENQAQIFEPFFTQRAGGIGLGLAVVRQIVQAHQGEIIYQTSPDGGAEFIVTLPRH